MKLRNNGTKIETNEMEVPIHHHLVRMITQTKYEYALSLSHMTEPELLRHSDELHEALDKKENIPPEQMEGLKESIQAVFEAILRRESLGAMSMDELNDCIVEHETEANSLKEAVEQAWTRSMEEQMRGSQIWEADARAEFMRRMTQLVHEAFNESSEDSADEESSCRSE